MPAIGASTTGGQTCIGPMFNGANSGVPGAAGVAWAVSGVVVMRGGSSYG
ncbi:hypothetical protein Kpho01_11230 [Kitasatospora phosalacinea]|uniref:Uncharacterized protein n=1 Tax=Kitasatospora phosalacinea TaxID=2065 RepID=A0A9W6UMF8_9ACTN|nr:hypothetical protein Kpho01_11230 [Kitasatospora phosalacinea]